MVANARSQKIGFGEVLPPWGKSDGGSCRYANSDNLTLLGDHESETYNSPPPSAEEFHYAYDSAGRVRQSAFAQTPTATSRQTNGSYYSSAAQAATRGRVFYGYDPAGRVLSVQHYWDTLSGSTFNSEAILASNGDYELTGMNRGLKLHSYSYVRTSAGSPNWTLANTQTYGYDPALDYLTSTSYTDGLSPSSQTWTYDAAGNRTDTVADNLNRPVTIAGVASTSDILGNRLTLGTTTYNWDLLNRMTSLTNPAGTTSYVYRADGMRTFKSSPSSSTLYRYDGQMGMEDVTVAAGATTVTDYALGARGVDGISTTTSSGTTVSYPLYDAHGSMISTLSKNGTGYTYSSIRAFDPWGIIRSANSTGDPKDRYCANLGHKQDDESGLVYMRARYYEPTSGRFISEDAAMSGNNWYAYVGNRPSDTVDRTGNGAETDFSALFDGGPIGALLGIIVPMLEKIYKIDLFAYNHPDSIDTGKTTASIIGIALLGVCGAVVVATMCAAIVTAGIAGGVILAVIAATAMICIDLAMDDLADDAVKADGGGGS